MLKITMTIREDVKNKNTVVKLHYPNKESQEKATNNERNSCIVVTNEIIKVLQQVQQSLNEKEN